MRGKACGRCCTEPRHGITPAYAGKSDDTHSVPLKYQDHPRLCGEKSGLPSTDEHRPGSPPPMRGKAGSAGCVATAVGITPAYAGKSWRTVRSTWCGKDHPRLCGEKTKKIPKQRYFFHQPASFSFSLQYT